MTIDNITLEALKDSGRLSVRAYNTCHIGEILTLRELVQYYKKIGTFSNIRNCGLKTENELVELAQYILGSESYQNDETQLIPLKNVENIDFIILRDGNRILLSPNEINLLPLSDTAKFVCIKNNLQRLDDLMNVFIKNDSFHKKLNCGFIIGEELIELCKQVELFHKKEFKNLYYKDIENEINLYYATDNKSEKLSYLENINFENLTKLKKTIIIQYIKNRIDKLTERAKNAIIKLIDYDDLQGFIKAVILEKINLETLRNIGTNTISELKSFRKDCQDYIYQIYTNDSNAVLGIESIINILESCFRLDNKILQTIRENSFITESIPIFNILNMLIDEYIVLDKLRFDVFKYSADFVHKSVDKTLDEISKKHKLSRERVRQIKIQLPIFLEEKLLFLTTLDIDFESNYYINFENNLIFYSEEIANKINKKEEVNFTNRFYTFITWLLQKDKYTILGNDKEIGHGNRLQRNREYNFWYLITNSIFEIFDFHAFLSDVYIRKHDKIVESYKLPFAGYLTKFLRNEEYEKINIIEEICEEILFYELDTRIDSDNYLIFERNTKKPVHEYAVDILEQSGKLMHIRDIFAEVFKISPDITGSPEALRGSIQREKDIFIFINRSSTYGLKKWENEYDDIKGGTIRDIVEEYLNQNDEPQHIYDIMQYVCKFRKTNEKSVLTNIKIDENRFVIFEASFIGLRSKNYNGINKDYKALSGYWFVKNTFGEYHGQMLDEVITELALKHGVKEVQVKNIITNKINLGELSLFDDGRLNAPYHRQKHEEIIRIIRSRTGKTFELIVNCYYSKEMRPRELNFIKSKDEFILVLRNFINNNNEITEQNFEEIVTGFLKSLNLISFTIDFNELPLQNFDI